MNTPPVTWNRLKQPVAGVVVAIVGTMALTACGGETNRHEPTRAEPSSAANPGPSSKSKADSLRAVPPTTDIMPDERAYTAPNDASRCLNLGARPCYVILRTSPAYTTSPDTYANVNPQLLQAGPSKPLTDGPHEAYGGNSGLAAKVICYTAGQLMGDFAKNNPELARDDPKSDKWYEVVQTLNRSQSPESYVANPGVAQAAREHRPGIDVFRQPNGSLAVGVFVSILNFHQFEPQAGVPSCASLGLAQPATSTS